jgi:hypothetical protein
VVNLPDNFFNFNAAAAGATAYGTLDVQAASELAGAFANVTFPVVSPVPNTPSNLVASSSSPVAATSTPASTTTVVASKAIKKADPQYVNFIEEDLVPFLDTELENLYYEQINGQSLIILNNKNFVNSGTFIYQPIVNVSEFVKNYDPKKLVPLQETSDEFFSNFAISLDDKIPKTPTSGVSNGPNVYISSSGSIVVETKDLRVDERVEIQILLNGTIYEDVLDLGIS